MDIIVTGASRGIGAEIVKYLDKIGGHSIYAISRNPSKLQALNKITSGNTHVFSLDLTEEITERRFLDFFDKKEKIDIIINNAGQLINKSFLQTKAVDFVQQFEANVISAIKLIQFFYPKLKKSDQAHIVNISSMGGYQGSSKFPGLSAYSTSKGALATLTECLAEEFIPDHIAVNALALGAVKTEMLKTAFPNLEIGSEPSEMAKYIADFAMSGHKFYNGKILPVSVSTP